LKPIITFENLKKPVKSTGILIDPFNIEIDFTGILVDPLDIEIGTASSTSRLTLSLAL